MFFFFFFQAEDGIRDYKVTGVQTCALPIWLRQQYRFSSECGHMEAGRRRVLVRPARGHDLRAGIELHRLGAVHMQVAEERVLPAAKGEVRHWHRDRHIDADHADLDLRREAPPGPTFIFFAFSASNFTSGSPAPPTATTAEIAMQRSPAEP